jgi:RNA polymerase sigma-70 factor (TIGR02960 family)
VGDAFGALVEPYRRELLLHCYRMLGSRHDAEDVLQETLLAAWQGLGAYEGRASMRTWLYRIATNRCLNARRTAARRPARDWNVPGVVPPEPTRRGEVVWLEPFPDALLPETAYEQAESISLAFMTALQLLPPRQVAVLVLRDVLEFPAAEVAGMLDTSVAAVHSALKRARTGMRQPRPVRPEKSEVVAEFVRAYQAADLDAVVALLTDDVFIAMPPMPYEYQGRDLVADFLGRIFAAGRRFDLVSTRANGQPAVEAYLRTPEHPRTGLIVLTMAGDRIAALTHFAV